MSSPAQGASSERLRHHPGITLSDVGVLKEKRAVPPFGTPLTMTVRLVANIQNRLFWVSALVAR
jgi:hypothetical protein